MDDGVDAQIRASLDHGAVEDGAACSHEDLVSDAAAGEPGARADRLTCQGAVAQVVSSSCVARKTALATAPFLHARFNGFRAGRPGAAAGFTSTTEPAASASATK